MNRAVERLEIGPGVRLSVQVPAAAREEPEEALPVVDVAGLAGASVTLRRGWTTEDGTTLRVGCVRAPSERWAPGVEDLVFGRATAIAHRSAPADIERWEAGPIGPIGSSGPNGPNNLLLEQRLTGQGRRPGVGGIVAAVDDVAVHGRHVLGFAGEARDAVLCTLVCVEPRSRVSQSGSSCADILGAALPEGAFMEAPPPSAMVRLILLAAERPYPVGLVGAALGALLIALILVRRPRPRS